VATECSKSPTAAKLKSDLVAAVVEEAVLDTGLNEEKEGK